MNEILLGDCRNEELVEELFGSTSEFARLIEENGNNFNHFDIVIRYDGIADIHYFYEK